MGKGPSTLQEAVVHFSDPENCRQYVIPRRWPNGIVCPTCDSEKVTFQPQHNRWQCTNRHPRRQFTLKTGTIMEDSPLGLDKWLPAMWLVASNRNGISSWELHRALGVTQKTAWFLLHRVRLAMQDEFHGGKIGGEVECDETFIGGKSRNMHKSVRERRIKSRGGNDKDIVMGILDRAAGRIRTKVIPNREKETLHAEVMANVEPRSSVYTDDCMGYWGLWENYEHGIINHLKAYVDGNIHTNGCENFWSLLKRCINGTYVSVEPFHLFRYVDEQAFRFNNRLPMCDGDRFSFLVRKIVGKRLTYAELTGKTLEAGPSPEEPF